MTKLVILWVVAFMAGSAAMYSEAVFRAIIAVGIVCIYFEVVRGDD